jgi:hypothetical protein
VGLKQIKDGGEVGIRLELETSVKGQDWKFEISENIDRSGGVDFRLEI